MIRAIVFDMDGVLIDAREWHYLALNRALDLFGMGIGLDDHLARFDGLPTRTKLEMLSEEQGLPRTLHPFINRLKQEYTIELVQTRCRPVFRREYAVAALKRDGYRIAVVSNSIRATIDLMMERSSLALYLDEVVSADDVTEPKPDPQIYQVAIERLGLDPGECLALEDSHYGIAAAEAAGCVVLRVGDIAEVSYGRIRAAIEANA